MAVKLRSKASCLPGFFSSCFLFYVFQVFYVDMIFERTTGNAFGLSDNDIPMFDPATWTKCCLCSGLFSEKSTMVLSF